MCLASMSIGAAQPRTCPSVGHYRNTHPVAVRAALGTCQGFVGCGHFYDRAGWLADGTEKSDDVGGVPVIDVRYRRPL